MTIPNFLAIGSIAGAYLFLAYFLPVKFRTLLLLKIRRSDFRSFEGKRIGRARRLQITRVFLGVLFGACVISQWVLGSFLAGFFTIFIFPFLAGLVLQLVNRNQIRQMQDTAMLFFYALQSLVHMGIAVPSALFLLSAAGNGRFHKALHIQLIKFGEGVPLVNCLGRFRSKFELAHVGLLLVLIEIAYREGLALSPLLEKSLPQMEFEQQNLRKFDDLRRGALAQGFIAGAIPWLLGVSVYFFQPDLILDFTGTVWFFPSLFLVAVFEMTGGFLLWKIAQFY
jgi:Flp pilus assembly protein TadB